MATLFNFYPFLTTLYADGGYQGPKFALLHGKSAAGLWALLGT